MGGFRCGQPIGTHPLITLGSLCQRGYISSSANDLGRYLQMYLNGGEGIISQQSIHTMFYGDAVYVEEDVPLRNIAIAIETNVNDYLAANNMVNSMGWSIVLMLLDAPANPISDSFYIGKHLGIDMIMLTVLLASMLPRCFLPRYVRNINRSNTFCRTMRSVMLHIMLLVALHVWLSVLILLIVPVFFETPLWVAGAFVPDVCMTVVVSSTLLFLAGVVKGVILYKHTHRSRTHVGTSALE